MPIAHITSLTWIQCGTQCIVNSRLDSLGLFFKSLSILQLVARMAKCTAYGCKASTTEVYQGATVTCPRGSNWTGSINDKCEACLDPLRRLGFQSSSSCSVWAWKNTLEQFHQQTLLSSSQEKLCFIFARKPKDYPGDTETRSPSHVLSFCGSLWPRLSPLTSWYPSKSKKRWIRWLYHPNSRTSRFF